ncbi:hypothetical protein AURDEDRAFT_171510 [Auricularia subglabra TFB-10046 SS5]|nr:hypothetical protein AURDEDRAFT_171510 [Auricularia subglabra TFB-10046 SS5]
MASQPLRRSSRASVQRPDPKETVTIPADLYKIAWSMLLPVPGTGFSPDFKGTVLLSLMKYLNFTPRDFMDWFFVSCSDSNVRQRAAQWVSPKGGNSPLVPLLQTIWEQYQSPAQSYIEAAIDPIVKDILVRESNAAISCRALSIRPDNIHLLVCSDVPHLRYSFAFFTRRFASFP